MLANPTTQIEHNRGRPTKSLIRSVADARETLGTVSLAPRELAGHYDSKGLLHVCARSDAYGDRKTSSIANTAGGKHA